MLHLHSLSSHVAVRNPNKLCSHYSFSLQDSIRTSHFISTVSSTRTRTKKPYLKCSYSESFQQRKFTSRPTSGSSFAPQSPEGGGDGGGGGGGGGTLPPRVFVGHSIYKGKAALTVEPRAPEFASLDSGAIKISKEGFVLLQFAPAAGVRQYDWSRKQVFSLSVGEIGSLISLGARDSCDFFHDPFKGRSDEGKVRKVLKVEPLPDGSGHFFNLSVQNKLLNLDENIYIPITKAEYAVLVSAFNFILPYLLGWHAFANSIKPDDSSRLNNANPRFGADFEWSR